MDANKLNFRPASVYRKRDFFSIIFYHRSDLSKDFKRYRRTFDLNRIVNLKVRAKAAKLMAETVTEALMQGWNPETDQITGIEVNNKVDAKISLIDGVKMANDGVLVKTDKKRTISSYNSLLNKFIEYLKEKGLNDRLLTDFDSRNAFEYQNFLIKYGYAGKTVNHRIEHLNGCFGWLVKMQYLDKNPFTALDRVKETPVKKLELFTAAEIEQIKKVLFEQNPALWQIFLLIFYCYLRPASIVHLKPKDFDFERGLIFVDGKYHKNGKDAYKQILSAHKKYLLDYLSKNDLFHKDCFVFSKDLKPGTKLIAPTRIAGKWKELIKDGLGINKDLYLAKSTGAAWFVRDNPGTENLKWLQMQMSHSDLAITSIYTNKLKIVRLGKEDHIPEI